MPSTPEETIAGRYRVEREIARGGMGAVLLAEDLVLNRRVAVKRLHPHLSADDDMAARFKHEALAAASLTHSGVVTVFDAGDDEAGAYLVMELIDGETLADRLTKGPLSPEETARLGAEVARALDHAHEKGIVHRDVKPGNIMLLPDGRVKIGDFGIAKTLEGSTTHTETGKVLGTASYLSPEQLSGQPATPASDMYSLGAVLYEAVAGEKPFVGDNAVQVAMAHQTQAPPPLPAQVPDSLSGVILRALAKEPLERFPTASDMAAALETVAGGGVPVMPPIALLESTGQLPVTEAVPATAAYAGRRRDALPWVLGGLAAMVLLVGAALLLWPALTGSEDPVDRPGPSVHSPSPAASASSAPAVNPSVVTSTSPPPSPSSPPTTTQPPTTSPPPSPTTPPPTPTATAVASPGG